MDLKIKEKSTLLMIGDSITDCERARPIGDGLFSEKLGNGYVSLVAGILGAVCPEKDIHVLNMGVGGNTVCDLRDRWQTDALDLKPDWVSVMVGINEVWREMVPPLRSSLRVPVDEYEIVLDEIVKLTLPLIKGMVLITPFFVEPNRLEPMRVMTDRYGAAVKNVAKKYKTVYVDTQAVIDILTSRQHPMGLSWDRVHINLVGHMAIARAFTNAIGLAW